ncbi:hypothetical protein GO730_19605 [Spirosoma sp. HMF3257]|uniref:Tail specific protease domain-containing protein n=1 Tax=Spirosoma telluris TaxID=2183553 RepID=A0A327NKT9_9BACT|nr:hypothetical protein [Spirosoma telluris]RAI75807.1 hypothetical protein HMF3257_19540 [Spirosoma telluris]
MKLRIDHPFWVRVSIALLLPVMLPIAPLLAQPALPLIKANSTQVRIKDGYVVREGIWTVSPQLKPDTYTALEPFTNKTITFYTDVDSIAFSVKPGHRYAFNILLQGKDTCLTQIVVGNVPNGLATSGQSELPLNTEQLAMDFVVFRDYLKHEHPGLYRYRAKEKIDKLLDSCLLSIDRPLASSEFAKKILFSISHIQDAHTGTTFTGALVRRYQDSTKLFPIDLYFAGDKAFIVCSNSGQIEVGSELLSINNRSITAIRQDLFSYLPSDGSIQTKKIHTVNNGAFPFLYKWIIGHGDSLTIDYKPRDKHVRSATIGAELVKNFTCTFDRRASTGKLVDLSFPQPNVALMTITTFDESRLSNAKLDFRAFLQGSFAEINRTKPATLILDLRNNAGGLDEYGALLFSYLAKGPFNYFTTVESTHKKSTVAENHLLNRQLAQELSFKGKVYILINGLSFSTTADFCAITKSNGRAQFVGEETGGGYYGNSSGQLLKIELPHSKLNVLIPRFNYVNAVKPAIYPDRGTIPDYEIIPTVDDLLRKRDVQLQYCLDLIQKK